jgi:hypothetical protein
MSERWSPPSPSVLRLSTPKMGAELWYDEAYSSSAIAA